MRNRALWITICVLAIILLLVVDASAQSTYKIYGYVRVDGNLTNGVTVRLSGEGIPGQPTFDTVNDGSGTAGYYEFIVNGSTTGKGLSVSASHDNRSGSYSFIMLSEDKLANLSLSVSPTPTPSPTPEPTPTPMPSGELGGMVIRNDSSSFIPASAHNPSTTPTPKPSGTPTAAPTVEPTLTPAPPAGILSNVYLWLVIALVAILAIAAAILLYLKK
jgi:hypothetical protein